MQLHVYPSGGKFKYKIPKACRFIEYRARTTKPKYTVSSIQYEPHTEHKSHNKLQFITFKPDKQQFVPE
jgi:hypothetical protein